MPMRNILLLSLLKKKVHIFLHFFFVLFKVFNPIFSFFFVLLFSFLPSKKRHKKRSAGFLCREESRYNTHARNEYISSKSHHCRSKDDEGKRYNAHTRERDVLRDDVGGGEKRERCREPSSFVVVVYVVVAK